MSFLVPFARVRALIVAVLRFYEWLKKGKDKLPHFCKPADGKLLIMAGLWDHAR